jgi:uncharacterized protein involved in exopolysaccharide biosynthesis
MARAPKSTGSSPSSSNGSSGKDSQLEQINQQIDSEKVNQAQNRLEAEKEKTKATQVLIEIAQVRTEIQNINKSIAETGRENANHKLTDAQQSRDLTAELTRIRKELHEDRVGRERRKLLEFEDVY